MPPKRKSAVLEPDVDLTASGEPQQQAGAAEAGPVAKKARAPDVAEGSSAGAKKGKAKAKVAEAAPKDWREVKLEGEDEVRSR